MQKGLLAPPPVLPQRGAPLGSAATRLGNRARSRRASACAEGTHTLYLPARKWDIFTRKKALKQVFLTLPEAPRKRLTRLNQSIGTALTTFLQSFLQGSHPPAREIDLPRLKQAPSKPVCLLQG
jgi:hypothetical protein